MKLTRLLLVIAFLLSSRYMNAQKFFSKEAPRPLSFLEMQRQFDSWKNRVDLKSEKNWKYFKRWEMDMQMHTDASGKPGDPAVYIDAITKAPEFKNLTQQFTKINFVAWNLKSINDYALQSE